MNIVFKAKNQQKLGYVNGEKMKLVMNHHVNTSVHRVPPSTDYIYFFYEEGPARKFGINLEVGLYD